MINLQDAIERAKLASDNDGLLSSYTYEQIVQELEEADRHAFTMALVDLGINTRRGSKSNFEHISKVIYGEGLLTEKGLNRQVDILDDFRNVARAFSDGSRAHYAGKVVEAPKDFLSPSKRASKVSDKLLVKFKELV